MRQGKLWRGSLVLAVCLFATTAQAIRISDVQLWCQRKYAGLMPPTRQFRWGDDIETFVMAGSSRISNRYMSKVLKTWMGNLYGVLLDLPADTPQSEKVQVFREGLHTISDLAKRRFLLTWNFHEATMPDHSVVFHGVAGKVVVIRPDGRIFKGSVTPGLFLTDVTQNIDAFELQEIKGSALSDGSSTPYGSGLTRR